MDITKQKDQLKENQVNHHPEMKSILMKWIIICILDTDLQNVER